MDEATLTNIFALLRKSLVAERIAIDSYRERIRYLGDKDPTRLRLMDQILSVEEVQPEDLSSLLEPKS